jgi:hypothetical protein
MSGYYARYCLHLPNVEIKLQPESDYRVKSEIAGTIEYVSTSELLEFNADICNSHEKWIREELLT